MLCKHGDNIVLTVSAVGRGPLSYQWKKEEKDITDPECTGTNTDHLSITRFSSVHQGSYSCIIKENHNSLKSESAILALGEHYRYSFQIPGYWGHIIILCLLQILSS
jgi:hypothetical protein